MPFLKDVPQEQASAEVRAIFEQSARKHGYVPNMDRLFSLAPHVRERWQALLASVRDPMDLRRYELVTLAAAQALRSSYCMLAHGEVLTSKFYSPQQVAAIAADFRNAGLDARDVAVMAFAQKVVRDATGTTQADIDGLRGHGLTDVEIFHVTAAAALRCFFSKMLDALGAQPDAQYARLGSELLAQLTVGRPVAQAKEAR
jgi:uncharacterized peroxidase-related enzyme